MAPTREEHAALVGEVPTRVVTGGDTDALGIFLSENAVDRRPVDTRTNGDTVGPTYWRALAATDIDITIEVVVATAEHVAIRGSVTSLRQESSPDVSPSSQPFEIAVAWFCRIEDSQIVETWSLPTGAWRLRQLETPPGGICPAHHPHDRPITHET